MRSAPSSVPGKPMRLNLMSRSRKLMSHRDESFNSITGLNGSGKSNILDAICFVLGITNMTTVRAQNLQVRGKAAAYAYSGSQTLIIFPGSHL